MKYLDDLIDDEDEEITELNNFDQITDANEKNDFN